MALSFVWSSVTAAQVNVTGLSSGTLSWSPANVEPGDLLFLFCKGRHNDDAAFHWDTPSGWLPLEFTTMPGPFGAAVGVKINAQVFARIADGSEAGVTVSVTADGAGTTRNYSLTVAGVRGLTHPSFTVEVDHAPSTRRDTPDSVTRNDGVALILSARGNVAGGADNFDLGGFTRLQPTNFSTTFPSGLVAGMEVPKGPVVWPEINPAASYFGGIFYKLLVAPARHRRGFGFIRG